MAIPGFEGVSLKEVATRAYKGFMSDDMTTYAAALSYHVLFAMFPFLLFLITFMGALGLSDFFNWLLDQAQSALPQNGFDQFKQIVDQIQGNTRGGLLSFGIVAALWGASSGIRSLTNALNVAYDVEESRPMWKLYPLSIVYTLALAVLMIAAAALMLLGPQAMQWIADQAHLGSAFVSVWTWLRLPVAIILLMLVVALVFYALPNVDQSFTILSPGAVLAVIVWVVASVGFSIYVANFGNYNATYGSLGGIIILLFYFYISAAVLMLGAEINAAIFKQVHDTDTSNVVGGSGKDANA